MQPEEEIAFDFILSLVEQLIRGKRVKVGQEVAQIRLESGNGVTALAEEGWLELDDPQAELIPVRTIEAKSHDVPQKDHSLGFSHKFLIDHSAPEKVGIEELARGLDVALDLGAILVILSELLVVAAGESQRRLLGREASLIR